MCERQVGKMAPCIIVTLMLHCLKLDRWSGGGCFNGRVLLFLSVLDLVASLALHRLMGRKCAGSVQEVQSTSTALELPQPDSHVFKKKLLRASI